MGPEGEDPRPRVLGRAPQKGERDRRRHPLPDLASPRLLLRHVDGYYTAEKVVDFLRDLLKHLRGRVVVVWDGGPNHKGPAMRDFLRRNRRLRLERLPAYSPHLNPVEAVWSWLKYGQLANFVPSGLVDLDDRILDRPIELRLDPALLRQLWDASDLPFPEPLKCKSG